MESTQVISTDEHATSVTYEILGGIVGVLKTPNGEFDVRMGSNKIGRDPLCDIVFNDVTVSKHHATIEAENDNEDIFIFDTGSTNKTKLRRTYIRPFVRYHLTNGIKLAFGNVECVFATNMLTDDEDPQIDKSHSSQHESGPQRLNSTLNASASIFDAETQRNIPRVESSAFKSPDIFDLQTERIPPRRVMYSENTRSRKLLTQPAISDAVHSSAAIGTTRPQETFLPVLEMDTLTSAPSRNDLSYVSGQTSQAVPCTSKTHITNTFGNQSIENESCLSSKISPDSANIIEQPTQMLNRSCKAKLNLTTLFDAETQRNNRSFLNSSVSSGIFDEPTQNCSRPVISPSLTPRQNNSPNDNCLFQFDTQKPTTSTTAEEFDDSIFDEPTQVFGFDLDDSPSKPAEKSNCSALNYLNDGEDEILTSLTLPIADEVIVGQVPVDEANAVQPSEFSGSIVIGDSPRSDDTEGYDIDEVNVNLLTPDRSQPGEEARFMNTIVIDDDDDDDVTPDISPFSSPSRAMAVIDNSDDDSETQATVLDPSWEHSEADLREIWQSTPSSAVVSNMTIDLSGVTNEDDIPTQAFPLHNKSTEKWVHPDYPSDSQTTVRNVTRESSEPNEQFPEPGAVVSNMTIDLSGLTNEDDIPTQAFPLHNESTEKWVHPDYPSDSQPTVKNVTRESSEPNEQFPKPGAVVSNMTIDLSGLTNEDDIPTQAFPLHNESTEEWVHPDYPSDSQTTVRNVTRESSEPNKQFPKPGTSGLNGKSIGYKRVLNAPADIFDEDDVLTQVFPIEGGSNGRDREINKNIIDRQIFPMASPLNSIRSNVPVKPELIVCQDDIPTQPFPFNADDDSQRNRPVRNLRRMSDDDDATDSDVEPDDAANVSIRTANLPPVVRDPVIPRFEVPSQWSSQSFLCEESQNNNPRNSSSRLLASQSQNDSVSPVAVHSTSHKTSGLVDSPRWFGGEDSDKDAKPPVSLGMQVCTLSPPPLYLIPPRSPADDCMFSGASQSFLNDSVPPVAVYTASHNTSGLVDSPRCFGGTESGKDVKPSVSLGMQICTLSPPPLHLGIPRSPTDDCMFFGAATQSEQTQNQDFEPLSLELPSTQDFHRDLVSVGAVWSLRPGASTEISKRKFGQDYCREASHRKRTRLSSQNTGETFSPKKFRIFRHRDDDDSQSRGKAAHNSSDSTENYSATLWPSDRLSQTTTSDQNAGWGLIENPTPLVISSEDVVNNNKNATQKRKTDNISETKPTKGIAVSGASSAMSYQGNANLDESTIKGTESDQNAAATPDKSSETWQVSEKSSKNQLSQNGVKECTCRFQQQNIDKNSSGCTQDCSSASKKSRSLIGAKRGDFLKLIRNGRASLSEPTHMKNCNPLGGSLRVPLIDESVGLAGASCEDQPWQNANAGNHEVHNSRNSQTSSNFTTKHLQCAVPSRADDMCSSLSSLKEEVIAVFQNRPGTSALSDSLRTGTAPCSSTTESASKAAQGVNNIILSSSSSEEETIAESPGRSETPAMGESSRSGTVLCSSTIGSTSSGLTSSPFKLIRRRYIPTSSSDSDGVVENTGSSRGGDEYTEEFFPLSCVAVRTRSSLRLSDRILPSSVVGRRPGVTTTTIRQAKQPITQVMRNVALSGAIPLSVRTSLKKLGSVLTEVEDATVLVTESVLKSFKLLTAVAKGIPIVTCRWVIESEANGSWLDPWDFIIRDEEAERRWGFNLKTTLIKAMNKPLLIGFHVRASTSSKFPSNEILHFAKMAGATILHEEPTVWPMKSLFLTKKIDQAQWPARAKNLKILDMDFLLISLFQYRLLYKPYLLRH